MPNNQDFPKDWKRWFKWIINRIDDPFDNFKHWWCGKHVWFGICFECEAYMKNRPNSKWSIKKC